MFEKRSDILRYSMIHKKELRRSIGGEPSKETLLLWSIEDQCDEHLLEYYLREEAAAAAKEAAKAEDFNVNITSEVRIK